MKQRVARFQKFLTHAMLFSGSYSKHGYPTSAYKYDADACTRIHTHHASPRRVNPSACPSGAVVNF